MHTHVSVTAPRKEGSRPSNTAEQQSERTRRVEMGRARTARARTPRRARAKGAGVLSTTMDAHEAPPSTPRQAEAETGVSRGRSGRFSRGRFSRGSRGRGCSCRSCCLRAGRQRLTIAIGDAKVIELCGGVNQGLYFYKNQGPYTEFIPPPAFFFSESAASSTETPGFPLVFAPSSPWCSRRRRPVNVGAC